MPVGLILIPSSPVPVPTSVSLLDLVHLRNLQLLNSLYLTLKPRVPERALRTRHPHKTLPWYYW